MCMGQEWGGGICTTNRSEWEDNNNRQTRKRRWNGVHSGEMRGWCDGGNHAGKNGMEFGLVVCDTAVVYGVVRAWLARFYLEDE